MTASQLSRLADLMTALENGMLYAAFAITDLFLIGLLIYAAFKILEKGSNWLVGNNRPYSRHIKHVSMQWDVHYGERSEAVNGNVWLVMSANGEHVFDVEMEPYEFFRLASNLHDKSLDIMEEVRR